MLASFIYNTWTHQRWPEKERKAMKATCMFQKWQQQYKHEHKTLSWVQSVVKLTAIKSMWRQCIHYKVYHNFNGSIQSFHKQTPTRITRLINLKCSDVVDQASNKVHKAVMAQKIDCVKATNQSLVLSSPIYQSIAPFNKETQARMQCKFDNSLRKLAFLKKSCFTAVRSSSWCKHWFCI